MRPLAANLILLATYGLMVSCALAFPFESAWPLIGLAVSFVVVSAMMRLKRPDTDESILFRNGLCVPFYMP